jgi:hypothetical protein
MICNLRACLPRVVLLCLCLIQGQGHAETDPPPAGMSQAQYDELVKSVGQSVLQTLAEKGLVAKSAIDPVPTARASGHCGCAPSIWFPHFVSGNA